MFTARQIGSKYVALTALSMLSPLACSAILGLEEAKKREPNAADGDSGGSANGGTSEISAGLSGVENSSDHNGGQPSGGMGDSGAGGLHNGGAAGEHTNGGEAGEPENAGAAGERGNGGAAGVSSGGSGAGEGGACSASRCATPSSAQLCLPSGKWDDPKLCGGGYCNGAGICGVCAVNSFSCTSATGLVCSAVGKWISNGSGDQCSCTVPAGRYLKAGPGLVLDTKTSLTWDSLMREAVSWPTASQTCEAAGMRLPLYNEWTGLMILLPPAKEAQCIPGISTPSPFDSAAFPGPFPTDPRLWTSRLESIPGNVVVIWMNFSNNAWSALETDSMTNSTTSHPYRCVSP
jgi:hypothetical protein